ncbi:MAG: hypothetical protein U5J83_00095 [Bryobacterales bacterium]|nr:hypothetical protein [Bryobacterales bacterium]
MASSRVTADALKPCIHGVFREGRPGIAGIGIVEIIQFFFGTNTGPDRNTNEQCKTAKEIDPMTKTLMTLFAMALLAVGIASAKTHTITLHSASNVGGHELKAGNYKLEIEGEKVTITNGRKTVESAAIVEETSEKFSRDSVRYHEVDGKMKVREIRLGGTNTKLVFSPASSTTSAQ